MFAGQIQLQLSKPPEPAPSARLLNRTMSVSPHCRRKSPLQPPDGDPGGRRHPTRNNIAPSWRTRLARSALGRDRRKRGKWQREPVPCASGGPSFALSTYSHFQARRCARSSPDHSPGVVRSKPQTSEIPATVRPRSERAEPQQSPPPEAACSRGFGRTAKYPLVLARVDHPRSQYGFRFFFFLYSFFIFSFNWWLWPEGGASLGPENQTEAAVSKV